MTDHDILRDVGEVLHGAKWQSPLARDLNMSDRHMRRLISGEAEIRSGMIADLRAVAVSRIAALEGLVKRLDAE